MTTIFTNTLLHVRIITTKHHSSGNHHSGDSPLSVRATIFPHESVTNRRKAVATTFLATSLALAGQLLLPSGTPPAIAEKWGTYSWLKEKYLMPDLSPEDSVARIRQTAEGLHSMREMLDQMAWRYVMFYIRLKQAYLEKDLKIAMATVPKGRRDDYVKMANELVSNMYQFDKYVRTPKVYESYLYYEKTLKSIDDLVDFLA